MISYKLNAPPRPASPDAVALIEALSATLATLSGDSGASSFDPNGVRVPNACFAVARDSLGQAVGCGAFRPLESGMAELKRMYAKPETSGVGAAILKDLEACAQQQGDKALWLETRRVNRRAVFFYQKHGYTPMSNFGHYAGNDEAVCFEKRL